jgi:NTP pyrophosphatase (non-canonical NTP hydrolase)
MSQLDGYQIDVGAWLQKVFSHEAMFDYTERNSRFLEEALELVQALGYDREKAHVLVDYVFDRPVGEKRQELGGVMVSLGILSYVNSMHMWDEGLFELNRINKPEVIEKIKEKQKSKPKFKAP